MMTVDQVAEKLYVSRNTVVNLIKQGKIKALKIGDLYRIPEESLDSFFITASDISNFTNAGAKDISFDKKIIKQS